MMSVLLIHHRVFYQSFWITFILISALITPASAQKTAFSELDFFVHKIENISNNDAFFRYWKAGSGLKTGVNAPFYLGRAELGIEYHSYPVKQDDIPVMKALYFYSGWSYPFQKAGFTLSPGVRLGNYRMIFDDNRSPFRSESDESEFSTGFTVNAQYLIANKIGVSLSASHTTVHTYNKLYLVYVGGGIMLRLQTSEKVSHVLSQ